MAALEHLRIADLDDREVLLVVVDLADADGWVLAYDVGERLGIVESHRRRAAAQRLSWLARYGAVEREILQDEDGEWRYRQSGKPYYGQRWRLTEIGQVLASGQLRAAQTRALDELDDAQLLLATRAIAERARSSPNATAAKLTEREWKHRWSRVNGYPPGY